MAFEIGLQEFNLRLLTNPLDTLRAVQDLSWLTEVGRLVSFVLSLHVKCYMNALSLTGQTPFRHDPT